MLSSDCEGSCEIHAPEIWRVTVTDKESGISWGEFWYCDEAIACDRANGLKVDVIEQLATGATR